jgi:hypothetical protein
VTEFFGKSPESVKQKIRRLGLKVVVRQIANTTTFNEELSHRVYRAYRTYSLKGSLLEKLINSSL